MPLRNNPQWGMRKGCFPSEPASLTGSLSIRDAAEISRRWTPVLNQQLTTADREELKRKAITAKTKLNTLSNRTQDVIAKFGVLEKNATDSKGELTRTVNLSWTTATAALTDLGTEKIDAFQVVDQLMVYAPDKDTAQEICQQKLDAEAKLDQTYTIVEGVNRNLNAKITEFYQKRDSFLAAIENLLKAFMAILEFIINVLMKAFTASFGFILWAKDHPKATLAIGGTISLLILGLILRPYITIISAAFKKKKKK